MKFKATSYKSPYPTEGLFTDVYIEDVNIIHNRRKNYLNVTFEMYYMLGDERIVLDSVDMGFMGVSGDAVTSNQTAYVSKDGVEEPLLQVLYANQGVLPEGYEIVEFGYPSYGDVKQYFTGGNFNTPEIDVENPIAIGFMYNKLMFKGEPVIHQFVKV